MRRHDSATEKKYRELLAQQERDGLSRKEIAARAGIKPSTLTWWGSELKRLDRERAEEEATTLMPVTIREVAASAGTTPPASPDFYEVVVGSGRVLRVPRGFEAAEVHALVRVLETAPC